MKRIIITLIIMLAIAGVMFAQSANITVDFSTGDTIPAETFVSRAATGNQVDIYIDLVNNSGDNRRIVQTFLSETDNPDVIGVTREYSQDPQLWEHNNKFQDRGIEISAGYVYREGDVVNSDVLPTGNSHRVVLTYDIDTPGIINTFLVFKYIAGNDIGAINSPVNHVTIAVPVTVHIYKPFDVTAPANIDYGYIVVDGYEQTDITITNGMYDDYSITVEE